MTLLSSMCTYATEAVVRVVSYLCLSLSVYLSPSLPPSLPLTAADLPAVSSLCDRCESCVSCCAVARREQVRGTSSCLSLPSSLYKHCGQRHILEAVAVVTHDKADRERWLAAHESFSVCLCLCLALFLSTSSSLPPSLPPSLSQRLRASSLPPFLSFQHFQMRQVLSLDPVMIVSPS